MAKQGRIIPAFVLLVIFGGVGLASLAVILQNRSTQRLISRERAARKKAEAALKETQAKMAAMKKKYEQYLVNLLGERRAAEVIVLAQNRDADGRLWTKLRFMEYAADGTPLEPQTFTVPGDEVYFDALVMQFKPERVKEGKAKSLYLFRRVFTDKTRPDMGAKIVELDPDAGPPKNYQSQEIPRKPQEEVWAQFRRCLADKEYAKKLGVRAIFGQATYKTLRKGYLYVLTIQDNGGLIIEEKPLPKILRGQGE